MNEIKTKIAAQLLQIKAIQLSPQKPFTWASGRKSPIYCDNRLSLSHPEIRNLIRDAFAEQCTSLPGVNMIAGVATAGIPMASILADQLELPLVYVRSKAKGHGRQNKIEGDLSLQNSKARGIEDLISTGGSSLEAVEALKEAGIEVLGVMAIFTYGFEESYEAFRQAACPLYTLSDFETLLEQAQKSSYISSEEVTLLNEWRKDPIAWDRNLKE